MITVLKAETTKKQRDKLIEWFESQGLKVHISEGEFQTVLGLVGDTSKIDEELVESLEMVESAAMIAKLPPPILTPEISITESSG